MKKIACSLLSCLIAFTAWAAPARRDARTITQPDGSTIVVYQHGDEHFHWMTNAAGEWIEQGEDGFYKTVPALSDEEIAARRAASPRRIQHSMTQASPLNIASRGLIILVNFKDLAFTTDIAEIDSMIRGQNYTREYSYRSTNGRTVNVTSEGSALQYFQSVSNGQYNPHFDVVGPVTLSNNYSYYGQNDGSGNDRRPEQMIREACELADQQFDVDFSQYDNDDDDYVDFVYVFYAGYGEADGGSSNTIWPHQWELESAYISLTLDGKKVNRYACSNELSYVSNVHDGIGTFCHEFSHVLGLPDLYTTDYSSHRTLVDWDIMDYGCYNNDGNTPCAYSGYERFFLGWAQPRLLTYSDSITLHELNSSNEVLLITESDTHNMIGNDPSPNTFYIVENRQQEGWDEYLPGHGMMLTRVNYSYQKWSSNVVNNTASSLGVDIIEARTNSSAATGRATDLFPTGAKQYTGITGHTITDIREEDGVIYFAYDSPLGTSIEQTEAGKDGEIIGIYSLTGQRMPTEGTLPQGVYIIQTTEGSYKIIR